MNRPTQRRPATQNQLDFFARLDSPAAAPPVTVAASYTAELLSSPGGGRALDVVSRPPGMAGDWPVVVSYGMGWDSTAMLVLLKNSGIVPSLILFADTGSERPETYAYLEVINAWLARVGFPQVTVVRYKGKGTSYETLYDNCVQKEMLPSLAYGGHKHGCSLKFKVGPMDKHVSKWPAARLVWSRGGRVVRVIGYDDSTADNKRRIRFEGRGGESDDGKFVYWYALQDAHWDRAECGRRIVAEGLPLPPKSACWFCPSTKPHEMIELAIQHPDLAMRVIELERIAGPRLEMIDGLWGAGSKGSKGGVPKPGSMTEFLLVWMIDGRAYERLPQSGDPGTVPLEIATMPNVSKVYRRLHMLDADAERVMGLRRAATDAALALRREFEARHGLGSVEAMLAAGLARREARGRLARGRVLALRILSKRASLQKADAARWTEQKYQRVLATLRHDEEAIGPLVAEFGEARLFRRDAEPEGA